MNYPFSLGLGEESVRSGGPWSFSSWFHREGGRAVAWVDLPFDSQEEMTKFGKSKG